MIDSIIEEWMMMKVRKTTLVVVLIIPILVNFIMGWELSKGVIKNIPIAVLDDDNSSLSRKIIRYFAENETFNVKYRVDTQAELEKLINSSKVRTAIVIPKDFSKNVVKGTSPTILMVYDGSHMSIVSTAKMKASEILLTLKTGAAIQMMEGKMNMTESQAYQTALPISFQNRVLYNPTRNFLYFIVPGFSASICQTGIALSAVLAIQYEMGKRRSAAGYVLGKLLFYAMVGITTLMINMMVLDKVFKIPFRGSYLTVLILSTGLALAVSALSTAVSAWVKNRVVAIVAAGLLIIPNSIMAGYTWPVMAMPALYRKTAWIIPYYHYAGNIRNLFLRGGTIGEFKQDILYLLCFTAVMFMIAVFGMYIHSITVKEVENNAIDYQ
ncbi:ABC transporter permease [Petroclostridium sp. X23]|uniref:ABC transporter permease n=1 Tax=Petroclostridium sp. X23 TaxID=3045146 RepID=UPI0024ADF08B|nr:ABC transporter permease [Petroclostridium sp. X23]WHH58849.1 ABC transporter permease [Petroclostridium sp. X23]